MSLISVKIVLKCGKEIYLDDLRSFKLDRSNPLVAPVLTWENSSSTQNKLKYIDLNEIAAITYEDR